MCAYMSRHDGGQPGNSAPGAACASTDSAASGDAKPNALSASRRKRPVDASQNAPNALHLLILGLAISALCLAYLRFAPHLREKN